MGRYNYLVRDQRHTARAMKVSLPYPHPDLLPERTEARFGGRTPRLHRGPANGRNRRKPEAEELAIGLPLCAVSGRSCSDRHGFGGP